MKKRKERPGPKARSYDRGRASGLTPTRGQTAGCKHDDTTLLVAQFVILVSIRPVPGVVLRAISNWMLLPGLDWLHTGLHLSCFAQLDLRRRRAETCCMPG